MESYNLSEVYFTLPLDLVPRSFQKINAYTHLAYREFAEKLE